MTGKFLGELRNREQVEKWLNEGTIDQETADRMYRQLEVVERQKATQDEIESGTREKKLSQILREDPDFLYFLEGPPLSAIYNRETGNIEYSSPGSSAEMGRGMDYYSQKYPEVFRIMTCVAGFDDIADYPDRPIRRLTEREIEARVKLRDLAYPPEELPSR